MGKSQICFSITATTISSSELVPDDLIELEAGEILVMFIASVSGLPIPLISIHILWVNLSTDRLPAGESIITKKEELYYLFRDE